jgi:hypothetical protein
VSKPVPSKIYTTEHNPEVFFAEVFERPNTSLTRPPIGVIVFRREGEYQVSVGPSGRYTGDYTMPEGVPQLMSDVVPFQRAKQLLKLYTKVVRDTLQAEWDAEEDA